MATSKRKLVIQGAIGLILLFGLLFLSGFVVGYLEATGRLILNAGAAANVAVGLFSVAVIGVGVWIGIVWMKSIDEAAQEAHKWAWYWGGSLSMAAGLAGMMVLTIPRKVPLELPSMFSDRTDPAAYMATGAMGILVIMLIGYMLAWGWWWLQRR